jgi:restriction system protein
MAMARDVARAQKQAEAARQRASREQDRHYRASLREIAREERQNLRSLKEQAREEKLQYLEDRQEEAATLAAEAQQAEEELSGMLGYTLLVNDRIDFDALRIKETMDPFEPSSGLRLPDIRPSLNGFRANAKVPSGGRKMLPGAEKRRGRALEEAQARFDRADAEWQISEAERLSRYEAEKRVYDDRLAAFEQKKASRDAEVDAFRSEYEEGDPNAIVSYCTMVLERSQYPEGLPQKFSVAFTKASKQLVVEYELPTIDIVPAVMEFRYNRSQDEIVEKPRKPAEIKSTCRPIRTSSPRSRFEPCTSCSRPKIAHMSMSSASTVTSTQWILRRAAISSPI